MLKVKDKTLLLSMDFRGRGGKEEKIAKLFPTLMRTDSKETDFFCKQESIIYETKKQGASNWFDLIKFHMLSENEQKIKILFIVFDKKNGGLVDLIFSIDKGKFLKILVDDDYYKDWNFEGIGLAYKLKKVSPGLQTKTQIYIRTFFKKYREEVDIIYEK